MPQTPQLGAKMTPRPPNLELRCLQDAPRCPQESPKVLQDPMLPRCPKDAPRCSKDGFQDVPEEFCFQASKPFQTSKPFQASRPLSLQASKPASASAGCAKRKQSARPLGQGVQKPPPAYHSLPGRVYPSCFLPRLASAWPAEDS